MRHAAPVLVRCGSGYESVVKMEWYEAPPQQTQPRFSSVFVIPMVGAAAAAKSSRWMRWVTWLCGR
jgi:hypothetical protein